MKNISNFIGICIELVIQTVLTCRSHNGSERLGKMLVPSRFEFKNLKSIVSYSKPQTIETEFSKQKGSKVGINLEGVGLLEPQI